MPNTIRDLGTALVAIGWQPGDVEFGKASWMLELSDDKTATLEVKAEPNGVTGGVTVTTLHHGEDDDDWETVDLQVELGLRDQGNGMRSHHTEADVAKTLWNFAFLLDLTPRRD
jgi:hypothetical protein